MSRTYCPECDELYIRGRCGCACQLCGTEFWFSQPDCSCEPNEEDFDAPEYVTDFDYDEV